MTPRVSICVPNLNTRPFLQERFDTIFNQTFSDWELLVYDSYSRDGAWEYIQALASSEPRMRAWQGPREGTPGSWTPCVRAARGEYVYIATSDDTMPPDAIEQLVAALDAHPECDLAHCRLWPIDEHDAVVPGILDWWLNDSAFAQSSRGLLDRPHVRRAPHDGLLHLLGGSVYVSITQLLIRRSLFDRVGYFESTWGSIGDFNWAMRAGLTAHTVHVPDTWGGWRVHSTQATAGVSFLSEEHGDRIDRMIHDAIVQCGARLPAPIVRGLRTGWLTRARELRAFSRKVARNGHQSRLRRAARVVSHLCAGSWAAREYVASRLLDRPPVDWIRRLLASAGAGDMVLPAEVALLTAARAHRHNSHVSTVG